MIRKLILFVTCVCLAVIPGVAENQEIEVNLNRDNSMTQTCDLGDMGNLIVTAQPNGDQETARITIEIENTTGSYGLILFKDRYGEKELKKLKDASFYEVKTKNDAFKMGVESTDKLSRNVFIDHDEKTAIPVSGLNNVKNHESVLVSLPFYSCTIERKNKNSAEVKKLWLLLQRTFEVKIRVDMGPDEKYEALKAECDNLIKEISNATFCTNDKHKPKLQAQLDNFKSQADALCKRVRELAYERDIMSNNIAGTKYQALIDDISKAYNQIEPADCGKHKPTVTNTKSGRKTNGSRGGGKTDSPQPKYTAKECLGALQGIYKALDNGRLKGKKAQAISEAKVWYDRVKSLSQSKQKQKAIETYNKIVNK